MQARVVKALVAFRERTDNLFGMLGHARLVCVEQIALIVRRSAINRVNFGPAKNDEIQLNGDPENHDMAAGTHLKVSTPIWP